MYWVGINFIEGASLDSALSIKLERAHSRLRRDCISVPAPLKYMRHLAIFPIRTHINSLCWRIIRCHLWVIFCGTLNRRYLYIILKLLSDLMT